MLFHKFKIYDSFSKYFCSEVNYNFCSKYNRAIEMFNSKLPFFVIYHQLLFPLRCIIIRVAIFGLVLFITCAVITYKRRRKTYLMQLAVKKALPVCLEPYSSTSFGFRIPFSHPPPPPPPP